MGMQMNAHGAMINPLAGLTGINAEEMAGLAAALEGLPGAAAIGQFGQLLNATFNWLQPNWNPAAMGQLGAATLQAANAQYQLLSNLRALTGAGGANPLVQKQTAEQLAAVLLRAQQAAVGSNSANAPPTLVHQLMQAQQPGIASADVIRFLQAQNAAQAPAAASQQTVATKLTQELASATPWEQKQLLGEKLYPLIHNTHARTLFFTNARFPFTLPFQCTKCIVLQ